MATEQSSDRFPRAVLTWVLVVVLGGAAVLYTSDLSYPLGSAFWNAVVTFAALGLASEGLSIRLRSGTTSSVAFIPYLGAVLLFPSGWAALIAGSSELIAEAAVRKKPPIKIAHNTAKRLAAVGLASIVYGNLGGTPNLMVEASAFSFHAGAFAAAVLTLFIVDSGGTSVAVALSSRLPFREAWFGVVGRSLLFDLLSTPIAILLAYLYLQVELVGVLAVVVPLLLIRHVYAMNVRVEEANRDLLELMVKAIEARDPYTSGHSLRVARMASLVARELGLSGPVSEEVETAALLHDVGKIYEEYAPILRKDGRLTPEEVALMRTHSIRGFELVRTISSLRGSVDLAVRHHHENFDGTGYPDGLRGEDIPLASRIIMVADTTDAMTTDRPYRKALSLERVVHELTQYAGSQFDPAIVTAFVRSEEVRRYLLQGKVAGSGSPMGAQRASSPGIAYVG